MINNGDIMELAGQFWAYVIDRPRRSSTGKEVYREEPVLIIGFYISRDTLLFIYEDKGNITVASSNEVLYICPYGEDPSQKIMIKEPLIDRYYVMTRKEAIKRGYKVLEEEPVLETEEEEDDEESDDDTEISKPVQKPKQPVRRGRRKK